ncbi:MAG TPA: CCA tRNA nucleotidyltransferase [Rhizomicrobium sp.]|jgi:poly(A) polymerase|nr:CCA tRNA nucleotidyltransferase [Rhizomicrobium sp.]
MKTKLDPAREAWMRTKDVCAVMEALSSDGGEARFVGGAVRNALIGRQVDDIDIATPLVPAAVTQRLARAKIAALPTGIEHGTITAMLNGRAFEVTTLRRDVSTDGRRAVVAFSKIWEEDAARRDFTINALYASFDGELFDYNGGIGDLAAGRIRFIGDPVQRIREDYLRVLRLFRFHAWYGKGDIDAAALRAATAEREGLRILSGERIRKELLRLLEAEEPLPVLRAMQHHAILAEILPGKTSLKRLERLVAIDVANFFRPDPLLRLIAIAPADPSAQGLSERLKLSNDERDRLLDLAGTKETLTPYLPVREVRRMLYRLGKQRFRDRVLLAWADDTKQSDTIAWRALLALCDAWVCPRFPLSGRDVMAAGVPEGPLVGRILSDIEAWWIDSDFTDDTFSLAERLKAAVQAVRR